MFWNSSISPKNIRRMERIFKGLANHWRLEILLLVAKQPGINVESIAKNLKGNFTTIAEHARRLALAGLVVKKYQGQAVTHTLSPYGEKMVEILKKFINTELKK